MVPMLKIKNVLHPPTDLDTVEIRSDKEIVVRLTNGRGPFVLKDDDAKDFMSQLEPATFPRSKVNGLKEQIPAESPKVQMPAEQPREEIHP